MLSISLNLALITGNKVKKKKKLSSMRFPSEGKINDTNVESGG